MYIQLKALRRHKRKQPVRFQVFLLLLIFLLIAAIVFGSVNIDPILDELAQAAAMNLFNNTVNDAYDDFMSKTDMSYASLAHVNKNSQGKITSVTTDAEKLNRMCVDINNTISKLMANERVKVKVPLGTLTNIDYFQGKGPCFTVRLTQSNTVETLTKTSFKEAGLNQTEHIILLIVNMTMTLVLPNSTAYYEYTQEFVVAQSVIVGDVPSYYLTNLE